MRSAGFGGDSSASLSAPSSGASGSAGGPGMGASLNVPNENTPDDHTHELMLRSAQAFNVWKVDGDLSHPIFTVSSSYPFVPSGRSELHCR